MVNMDASDSLRLHHICFLERVMLALKRFLNIFFRQKVQTYQNVKHEWAF